jgi:hypothetical protein
MARESSKPTAAVAVRNPLLRNLVREDLEANGFHVTSVSATSGGDHADVVVTDSRTSIRGTSATIVVNGAIEFILPGRTVTYPSDCADKIPEILRNEVEGMAS